jgi:predicted trehalose synthase
VEVDVDGVKADDEVDESLETLSAGNLLEEGSLDLSAGRKLAADGNEEGERLGVDVSDVHTSLVGEEDDVALADRVDADVVLGVGRVRAEGLDDEVVEGTGGLLDLLSAVTSVLRY